MCVHYGCVLVGPSKIKMRGIEGVHQMRGRDRALRHCFGSGFSNRQVLPEVCVNGDYFIDFHTAILI